MKDDSYKTVRFLPVYYNDDEVEEEENGQDDDALVYESTSSTTVSLEEGLLHVTSVSERR